jgi:tetratricopeptide (TPR) repeat protein
MSLSWNPAAGWLLHSAVGGGVLLLLTCLLIRRTRQPARRQRLGELGLAAALVLALLSLRPPWLVLPYPVPAAPPPARAEAAPPVSPDDELVFAWLEPPAAPEGPALAPPGPVPQAAVEPAPAPESASPWWQFLLPLLPWLVVAHAVGAALLLSRWLLGHWALARLLRGATPAPAEVARLFEAMAPARRRPRLLVARRLRVPLSCGLLRPTVVLPASLCVAPDLQKLRWVFAHELTHLERRDAWSAVLFALGQAVYFFLPWFGWLRRQVRLCQEYVADAAAASQEEPAVDYAEFLLSLTGAPAVPAAASGVSGHCSDLYRRVSMLLKEPLRVEKRCPRRWSLTAAAGLFSLAVLVGGVGLRADAADDVVIVIRGAGDADKQAKSQKDKKVQVFVVPAPGEAGQQPDVLLHKKAPDGVKPVKRIVLQNEIIAGKPDVKANEERVKIIRDALVRQQGEVHRAEDVLLHRKLDLHLDALRKALHKLEQRHDQGEVEELRKEIRKALEKFQGGAALRAVQRPEDVLVLRGKKDEKKSGKDLDAALDALRKALEALGKQPELESARQGLKQAIEQLERARKDKLGFYPPAQALILANKLKGTPGQPVPLNLGKWNEFAPHWEMKPFVPGKAIDPALLKQVRELLQQQKYAEAEKLLQKALEGAQPKGWNFEVRPFQWQEGRPFQWEVRSRASGAARLGVGVEKPAAALADQLNLPKGQGLIITSLKADSPAAKAGLKVNDVLLKVGGSAVPGDPKAFDRALDKIKGGEAVSAVVLRKGKQETVSGIQLSAGPGEAWRGLVAGQQVPFRGLNAKQGGVTTTIFRKDDRFTTRYQEASLSINLTGTIADGKARVSEITIQDGRQDHRYQSVEQVPAQYRDRVNQLLEMSGRGEMRIERK